ncbi:MATE family efflux transporter [Terribacillus saccharophilus]|uniref:MATE family efflux transporter n=1 Tax=Terribacillus saccharophilus TaxID=361277 RepID=A0ABX4GZC3_9BACI|nr:MATE family efflux transporter [Terribacillus saccharophilus]PAD35630.1 MATE family efflux transporter [Terribacillus saccharophilus]PAD96646.1 MATE family efflux transporter [Terribacillus saccharophilus]PAE00222.1 MATE family efflux transporter [Terribacillus saccharophilus]
MKQLFTFAGPIMLTNLLQVSYQFIDSLWVGNLLGANALGAVTVSSTVLLTILAFIIGINNTTLTVLSQQRGRGDNQGLKAYLNAFVVVLGLLSIFVGIIGLLFSRQIVIMLHTPAEMVDEARTYLQVNFIGILFLMGYNFIGTVLRALGDSKTPLKFVLVAVILNTILDPLFISGFGLGIEGAAYATVLSQAVAFLLGLWYTLRNGLAPLSIPFLPKKEQVLLILKLGIPSGLQMMVIYAGVTAIMSVVNSFGGSVVAGFGASQRIDSLITLPAMALGTAVNSMAGQNIGIGRWDRVKEIAKYGALFNLAIMLVIAILVFLLAEPLTSLFIDEESAVSFGTDYLKIIAFFYPFIGLNFILNGIVRSSGAMYQVLILNILSFWLLRYPLTYICSAFIGENGIALGMGISFILSSIFSFSYYKWGKWDKKQLFADEKI